MKYKGKKIINTKFGNILFLIITSSKGLIKSPQDVYFGDFLIIFSDNNKPVQFELKKAYKTMAPTIKEMNKSWLFIY